MRKLIFLALIGLSAIFNLQAQTQGQLAAVSAKDGKNLGACPLKHTDVKAEISGFISRVTVTQEFENNFTDKIEAVYIFPLPNNAAVDDLTMRIGERTVRGKILKREEAREVYETAKNNGQIASLLDQERPNIFTQSVANILPGEKISIEISYVETLKYEAGSYEFVFPMTVGPRYIPSTVADAAKISPPIAKDRAGHDISLSVKLDAGVPVDAVESKSHEIEKTMLSANSFAVKLKDANTIPNKDFILRYDVAGKKIEDAVLTHRDASGGYFTLILQPPDKVNAQDVTPKEIVFVLDTSGSMSGFPIEKAKESMKLALDNLNPQDTFNLITFAGDTAVLFDKPVAPTAENMKKAQDFLASRNGAGGTEMMKAIVAALEPTDAQDHVRIVCFMTDGYVGNETEILAEIQKHPNARVFSFGIGSSVNRYLLDKIAEEGRGEAEYVALNDDGSAAARKFYERVRSPLLTDISLDYGDLQVADVYPQRINDLFSAKPVIIHGRYTKAGNGTIKLKGKSFGRDVVREIPVTFPENEPQHDVLAKIWARTRIDDLTAQDYQNNKPEIKAQITNLGIEYRLLTQFTSFVAVEERIVTDGGQPRKIEVPVELPDGMNREVNSRQIVDLPINGRRFTQFSRLGTSYTFSGSGNGNGSGNDEKRAFSALKVDSTTRAEPMSGRFQIDGASGAENTFVVDGQELTNARTGTLGYNKDKSGNQIIFKASNSPKPIFPPNVKTSGAVNVEVTLDANGKVVSAKAVDGDKLFYQAAETAAKKAVFEIPKTDYEIVKVTGNIAYDFAKNKVVTAAENLNDVRIEIKPNKYQSAVKSLVERLKNKTAATADEAKFVRDNKADLIVRVAELKPETVAALKNLGFEVLTEMPSANAVVGRIAIEKIAALAEIEAVTFISAQTR